jgi:hypothetical protein
MPSAAARMSTALARAAGTAVSTIARDMRSTERPTSSSATGPASPARVAKAAWLSAKPSGTGRPARTRVARWAALPPHPDVASASGTTRFVTAASYCYDAAGAAANGG